MQIMLLILIVIASLIALLLIIALFIKKEYTILRYITINKPKQHVFNYVKFLKNQDHFSKWVMQDPSMKKIFKGTDGTVGFVYAWESENKNAGKGEQEIMSIEEGETIEVEVRFEKPFAGIAKTPFRTESISENQTKVIWGMYGKSRYPMNLMNPFMGNLLGKDLEISLATLKSNLEK